MPISAVSPIATTSNIAAAPEGGYRWIEDRGRVVEWNEDGSVARMIGAHRDIHEEELARLALEQRNRELNSLVEARSPDLKEAKAALEAKIKEV